MNLSAIAAVISPIKIEVFYQFAITLSEDNISIG
jgi:hypothetical protein